MTRAYLIDVENGSHDVVNTTDWRDISRLVNCDMFDMTRVRLGNVILNAYVDDMGAVVGKQVSAVIQGKRGVVPRLFGNILLFNSSMNEDGEEFDMTDEQVDAVSSHIGEDLMGLVLVVDE